MKNPCYKCEERIVGCHSSCEKYKSFRIELEEEKKKIVAGKQIQSYTDSRKSELRDWFAIDKKNGRKRRYKR